MKIEGSLPKVHWVIRLHPSLLHLILCWLLHYLLPSFTVSSAASLPASVLHPCAVTMMDRWRVLLSSQICSCRKPRLTAVTVIPGTSVLALLVSFPSLLCPYLIYSHLCQNYTHAHKHPSAPHTQTRTRASSATVTTRNGRLKPRQPSSILTLLTPPPAAGVGVGGYLFLRYSLLLPLCVCVCFCMCAHFLHDADNDINWWDVTWCFITMTSYDVTDRLQEGICPLGLCSQIWWYLCRGEMKRMH